MDSFRAALIVENPAAQMFCISCHFPAGQCFRHSRSSMHIENNRHILVIFVCYKKCFTPLISIYSVFSIIMPVPFLIFPHYYSTFLHSFHSFHYFFRNVIFILFYVHTLVLISYYHIFVPNQKKRLYPFSSFLSGSLITSKAALLIS